MAPGMLLARDGWVSCRIIASCTNFSWEKTNNIQIIVEQLDW
jgi:hypothetical protein